MVADPPDRELVVADMGEAVATVETLGAVVLLVALMDEWVLEFRGERQVVTSEEALHNE